MLDDLLKTMLMNQMMQQHNDESFKSITEARDALKEFLDKPKTSEIKEGDYVERNEYGLRKYRFPSENQAAAVYKILPETQIETSGDCNDMIIAVSESKNNIKFFSVDSRYYRVANSNVNIVNFRKKS